MRCCCVMTAVFCERVTVALLVNSLRRSLVRCLVVWQEIGKSQVNLGALKKRKAIITSLASPPLSLSEDMLSH